MYLYRKGKYIYKSSVYTPLVVLLFLIIFLNISTLGLESNSNTSTNEDIYTRFSNENSVSANYSGILKELNEKSQIGTMHSYRFYKNSGQTITNKTPSQIINIQHILKGLSNIAFSALKDEMDSKVRLANIEELILLERNILNAQPLGINNVQLADSVSILISALIFQEVADSNSSNLEKIQPFLKRNTLNTYYTSQVLNDLFVQEMDYKSTKKYDSQYDLIINLLLDKSPEFANKYTNKENILEEVLDYMFTSHKPDPRKSKNSFIDIEPFDFVSNFFAVRNAELLAQFSVDYIHLRNNSNNIINSHPLFKQKLIKEMTDFDKKILGNSENEKDMDRIISKMEGHIRDNIQSKGKKILEQIYRRCLVLSNDDDLPELK